MFYELGYATDVFEPDAATMATVRLMAPFSFLKSITFNGPYSYIDNVLFKGNTRTLEKLHLTIGLDFIRIADKHRIFTRNRLVCLQSIQLYNCVPRIFTLESLKMEFENTMRSIFTTAQLSISVYDVQLYSYSNFEVLLSALDNGLVSSWVQSIKIPDCLLSFAGIVQVIRSVRYLHVLHCSLLTEWPCIDGVEGTELVWHIESFGDAFGRYFYLLAIHNEMPFWRPIKALIASLLVVACPQFKHFHIKNLNVQEFNNALAYIAGRGIFTTYSARILSFTIR